MPPSPNFKIVTALSKSRQCNTMIPGNRVTSANKDPNQTHLDLALNLFCICAPTRELSELEAVMMSLQLPDK